MELTEAMLLHPSQCWKFSYGGDSGSGRIDVAGVDISQSSLRVYKWLNFQSLKLVGSPLKPRNCFHYFICWLVTTATLIWIIHSIFNFILTKSKTAFLIWKQAKLFSFYFFQLKWHCYPLVLLCLLLWDKHYTQVFLVMAWNYQVCSPFHDVST